MVAAYKLDRFDDLCLPYAYAFFLVSASPKVVFVGSNSMLYDVFWIAVVYEQPGNGVKAAVYCVLIR